jgi:hypothetical protein
MRLVLIPYWRVSVARVRVNPINEAFVAAYTDRAYIGFFPSSFAEFTIERFGRVDVLINNSGVTGPSVVLWDRTALPWLIA